MVDELGIEQDASTEADGVPVQNRFDAVLTRGA